MDLATEATIHLVTAIPGPRSAELQKRREAGVPRGVGSVLPIYVQRASGAIVEDVDGNQLLDFTGGIGCQNAGHVPPKVFDAIRDQAERFIHTCFMVTPYEGYVRLAEELECSGSGHIAQEDVLRRNRCRSG